MQHSIGKLIIVLLAAGSMAACTNSARFSSSNPQPATLTPVANSNVQTTTLPPLAGTTTADGTLLTTPDGQSQFPSSDFNSSDPLLGTQTNNSSIITADATGMPTTTQTRTLTGPLTEAKMLGGWTVISGANTCQINLTQTSKPSTNRFRASAPGCDMAVLNTLSSWQLAGTQVQLFSESGQLIATLLQSGSRFIGSLAGGQGISMVG